MQAMTIDLFDELGVAPCFESTVNDVSILSNICSSITPVNVGAYYNQTFLEDINKGQSIFMFTILDFSGESTNLEAKLIFMNSFKTNWQILQVSIVSHEPVLFNCSVVDNILYGLKGRASTVDIENAAVHFKNL